MDIADMFYSSPLLSPILSLKEIIDFQLISPIAQKLKTFSPYIIPEKRARAPH
jgi:hypothetical protein